MKIRTLGNSNLPVTQLGLGLAALGRPGYINLGHAADLGRNYAVDEMEAHAHGVLDAAWAAGIRYFDAARSYGRAEAFLASWLAQRQIAPDEVVIGSKWGYTYTADWQVNVGEGEKHEVKEHSLPVLQRQIGESRSILGEQLDLYQIHSATLESGVLEDDAVLGELGRLRDDGLAIGFSVSGPNQAETILRGLDVMVDGRPLFAAVQVTWNLLEQSTSEALRQAHEAGVGVIVKEALANGRLTPRNQAPSFQEKAQRLRQIADMNGTTVDALALAGVMQQPWAGVVLSGAANVAQLLSNVQALAVKWSKALADQLAFLVEPAHHYWQIRSELAWN
ncbi:MAG: aldo/keto reductase [Caldilineaceae bacterium]|nr:aldo/keto reductase [Caldilineaceae bacterium]